ncbi:hypothetical protein I312_100215 [Cryptococcus bacillisporus CA1280]|uniref:uncharacterized protein n=1 Tax=Cryptococcus bacillisporus CA1280 TaxID=1296109 RepID=UPI0033690CB0
MPDPELSPIDPALQQPTLNSIQEAHDSAGVNPLNEFAQQVLGREADAENLLDFGRAHSILGEEQTFGDLLQAERRKDGEDEDDVGADKHMEHHQHGHEHVHEGHMEGRGEDVHYMAESVEQVMDPLPGRARSVRQAKKRRVGDDVVDGDGQIIDPLEYAKSRKDNHREVESRRRQAIADGIAEIAQLLPSPPTPKEGKGQLLKRAVTYIHELLGKIARSVEDVAQVEQEKQKLRMDIAHLEARLADERSRSIRFESSWRQAEDLAASSNFELERVKAELEKLKAEEEPSEDQLLPAEVAREE